MAADKKEEKEREWPMEKDVGNAAVEGLARTPMVAGGAAVPEYVLVARRQLASAQTALDKAETAAGGLYATESVMGAATAVKRAAHYMEACLLRQKKEAGEAISERRRRSHSRKGRSGSSLPEDHISTGVVAADRAGLTKSGALAARRAKKASQCPEPEPEEPEEVEERASRAQARRRVRAPLPAAIFLNDTDKTY